MTNPATAIQSNDVQLADLLAYNVYRAFRDEDPDYSYFRTILPKIYRRRDTGTLAGLKVWPETSPLVDLPLRATTGSEGE